MGTTDGVVERVIVDVAGEGQMTTRGIELYQPPVTAYFEQYSNIMYTSYDVACETAISIVEPCLDKGDPTDTTYTNLGHEDRFRIVLDKNIPFAGTSTTTNTNWGSDTTEYAKGVGFGARLG